MRQYYNRSRKIPKNLNLEKKIIHFFNVETNTLGYRNQQILTNWQIPNFSNPKNKFEKRFLNKFCHYFEK
jgi:hypothetical protein